MRTSRKHPDNRKNLSKRVISQAVNGMEALESRTLFNATLVPMVIETAPSPSTYTEGQAGGVTLSATVLGNGGLSPSGTVTFFVGPMIIGTPQTLVAGTVVLSGVTTLPPGVDSVTADYSGDSNFVPTNSAAQTVTVTGSGTTTVGTTTALSASPAGSASSGANVTLTAVVSPASSGPTITGSVTFFDGSSMLGTGSVDGTGTASFSTTALPPGSNTLTATYGGDTNYSASNSNSVSETITTSTGTTPSTVSVSNGGPSTVTQGTSVTFDATVAPTGATGTVQFLVNGSTSLGSGNVDPTTGLASVTTSALPPGSDSITAVYSGDSNFAGSNSAPITETVTPGAMTSTITSVSSSTPTTTAGSSVTLTANVSPVGATGTVQFLVNGSTSLGSPTLNSATGVATLMTTALPVGSDSITAVYSGDSSNTTSTSSPITVTVTSGTLTSTTTTVNTTTPTITAGNPVTFTANVAPSGATGTVEFFSNGNSIGMGTLDGTGNATVTTSALTAGSDTITATYDGDSNFAGSTSANFTETVNPSIALTATTVTTNPNMMFPVGTTVMLTATISPTSATGTVQFFDGMTALGAPVTVVNGAATLSTGALIAGTHSITASYSGDAGDMPSTSMPVSINGTMGMPTLTTTSSATMITFGNSATFTATVAPMAADGPVATGTVTFNDGMTTLSSAVPLVNGVATFTAPSLTVGSHSITFTYSGDNNYAMGTAPAIIETVGTGVTTTTLAVSPNTTNYGQTVTLTATVSPSVATGTVTFFDGTTQLGIPATVNAGVATFFLTSLPTGSDSLTAVYSGDANYSPSTSMPVNETVNTASSSVMLAANTTQVVFGNPVNLIANVPISGATGTVSFFSGGTLVGTTNLDNQGVARLTASSLAVGSDSLTAVYSGDMNYDPSTSIPVIVSVSQGLSNTTLSANPTVATLGSPVTFTVTVAPNINGLPTPTGTVTITQDATVLATGLTLVNGTVTFTTTSLALGEDSITASYNGDSNYLTSTSTATPVGVSAVTASTSATTLTSSSLAPNYGDAVTFTAVVAPALTSNLTPTGTVTFFDGTVPLGTPVALSGGVALFTTSSLPPGTASITAVYNGDNNFNASTSAPVTETVIGNNNSGAYVTTLNVSTFNAAFGAPVTLTANVVPTEAGTPPPYGGAVTFFSGAQTLGAATLGSDGTAVFATPLPAGTDEITAAYNGGGPITASLPRMVAISSPATPSLAKANLPPAIIAGTAFHTNLPISITNLSAAQLKGLFTIQVFLDTSTTLDANRDLLTTLSKTFTLNGAKSRTFHAPETLSPTLPDGTYYFLVDVTDPNGLTNLVASKPVVVAAPFVALSAAVSATNPPNIAVGQSASLFVTLTNTGNETISGELDLSLTPSSDGVTQILGTGSLNTTIQPGKTKKYRLVLDTTALATGSYFPYITASLDGVSATAVGVTPFRIG